MGWDAKPLQVFFYGIFEALLWETRAAFSLGQLTEEQLSGDLLVAHFDDMATPAKLWLQQHVLDGNRLCLVRDFLLNDFILPLHVLDGRWDMQVEFLQS